MEVPGANLEAELQQNAYQVYHKEGLLSQQSSVVPNAPLLYEQQVLLSKLRQQNNASKENKRPSSPSTNRLDDSASQDTDDSRSDVCFDVLNVLLLFQLFFYTRVLWVVM